MGIELHFKLKSMYVTIRTLAQLHLALKVLDMVIDDFAFLAAGQSHSTVEDICLWVTALGAAQEAASAFQFFSSSTRRQLVFYRRVSRDVWGSWDGMLSKDSPVPNIRGLCLSIQ